MPCQAIKTSGEPCNKGTENICKKHQNLINKNGPNQTALNELKYKLKKQIRDEEERVNTLRETATPQENTVLFENLQIFRQRKKIDFQENLNVLRRQQRAEIERTGVDPDAPAKERQREEANRRIAEWRIRQAARMAAQNAWREVHGIQVNNGIAGAVHVAVANVIQPVNRGLQEFAADPQNVHTTEAVNQTKEIVAFIRKIPVPEGYRWHAIESSKTPFEIGMECKLSQRAAWQMVSQYAQDTSIYDIEAGIYGKVLDSVWQYVKNSSDKEDLCKIIKRELEDNIGMCAQGNLSRICNVLAGYLEGVGSQESLSERLGRLLAPLAEIPDEFERIRQACDILRENRVPHNEWETWTDPLIDELGDVFHLIKEQMIAAV
jgi:hypothetical protein